MDTASKMPIGLPGLPPPLGSRYFRQLSVISHSSITFVQTIKGSHGRCLCFFPAANTGLTLNTIGSLRCIPCGVPAKSTSSQAAGHHSVKGTDRARSISRTRSCGRDRPYTSPNPHVTANCDFLESISWSGCSFPPRRSIAILGEEAWLDAYRRPLDGGQLLMWLPYWQ